MPSRSDLEQLALAHHPGIWRYLRLIGCSREEADDLAQETFIVALRKQIEDRGFEKTSAYLRRTARNLFMDSRRRARRRREVDLELAEQVFVRLAPDGGDAYLEALRSCLNEQQGKAREAVRAYYKDQLPAADVARMLGLRLNGLKTLLQRARQALRDCVMRRLP